MQINIGRKNAPIIAIFAALIGLFLYLAINNNSDMNHSGHDMSMMEGSDQVAGSKLFSSNDVMFMQMMIPHHEQAITLSDMAAVNSKNPEILKLAIQIKAAQSPEITQMKKWLSDNGDGLNPGHSMDAMGGMLADSELDSLSKLKASAFDKKFLSSMIAHHIGAVNMVMMISNSKSAELKLLGQNIVKAQEGEIAMMQQMLAAIK